MLRLPLLLAGALAVSGCGGSPAVTVSPRTPGPYDVPSGGAGDAGPIPVTPSDPSRGSPLAPVTIVEFADFQCGYCQRAAETLIALQREYGPERVRVVWKNFPLSFHPNAMPAAEAAMAIFERAGVEGFWRYHDAIFHAPRALGRELFDEALKASGATVEDVKRGVREGGGARKIAADQKLGQAIGVSGTPTFYVNGVLLHGAQPIERFRAVVDDQLRRAGALVSAGSAPQQVYAELSKKSFVQPEAEPDEEPEDRTVYRVPIAGSPVRGGAQARVTIVELADFECPFCARAEEPLRAVMARYGDKVRFAWKHLPLPFHAHAEPAAELAIEARSQKGDAAFWLVHDLLLAANGRIDDAKLAEVAKAAGLDVVRAAKRVAEHAHAAAIVADLEVAEDLDVSGTPTFFINGRKLVGAQPVEVLQAAIDAELATTDAALARGVAPAGLYDALQANAKLAGFDPVSVPAPSAASPSRGPASAKLVVDIWSDFECPFCKRVEPTLAELEAAFPGKVRLVWHNNPIPSHPHAMAAAEAAMEAFAQGGAPAFWKMHDLLIENQGGTGQERPALEAYATKVGLDLPRFRAALDGGVHRAAILADAQVAVAAGLDATPGFIVGGYRLVGAQPLGRFRRIVRHVLGR